MKQKEHTQEQDVRSRHFIQARKEKMGREIQILQCDLHAQRRGEEAEETRLWMFERQMALENKSNGQTETAGLCGHDEPIMACL